jgi:3-oxoacyl-[acyl-carrier protein] reductase
MSLSKDPVAIITGGAKGIGLASAVRLLRSGFRVAITDIVASDLDSALSVLGSNKDSLLALKDDVRSYGGVQENAGRVMDRWGHIDVLVNSAGISQPKGLLEIT